MSKSKLAWEMHKADPRLTQQQIADALGVSRPTVSVALKRYRTTAGLRCKHCGSLLPYLKDAIKAK